MTYTGGNWPLLSIKVGVDGGGPLYTLHQSHRNRLHSGEFRLLLFKSLSISPCILVIRSEFLNMASSDRYMKLRLLPAPRYGRTREQSLIGPSLPSMKFFQAITILAENQSFRVAGGRKEGREVSRFFKAWSPSASLPSEFGPENQYLLLACLSIRPFVRALFVAIL